MMEPKEYKDITKRTYSCIGCPYYKPVTINTDNQHNAWNHILGDMTIGICTRLGKPVKGITKFLEDCPYDSTK